MRLECRRKNGTVLQILRGILVICVLFMLVFDWDYPKDILVWGTEKPKDVMLLGTGNVPQNSREWKETVVRVAFFDSKNYLEGAEDDRIKSGYAYEFLQKISNYTGWRYEYVYGSWSDLYQQFLEGKIDLFPGLERREIREGKMLFPDYPMDVKNQYIYTLRGKIGMVSEEFAPKEKMKVGCLEDSDMLEKLEKWLEEMNITAQIVIEEDEKELIHQLESGEIDALSGADSLCGLSDNIVGIQIISSENAYLCVRNGGDELLESLNEAMEYMELSDSNFIYELREKYFPKKVLGIGLNEEEREWLSENKSIKLGYVEDYLLFSGTDADGHVTGIIKDICEQLLYNLNIREQNRIEFIEYPSYEEMLRGLNNNDVDVIFPVISNAYHAEQNNMMETTGAVSSSVAVIYKGDFSSKTMNKIAISSHSALQTIYAGSKYPDSEILIEKSLYGTLSAVLEGRATCTIFNAIRAELYIKDEKYDSLKTMILLDSVEYSLAVKKGNVQLLSILNKGIDTLDKTSLLDTMYGYAKENKSYGFKDFVKQNFWKVFVFTVGIIAILSVSFTVFAVGTTKRKKADALKRETLQERMNIAQSMSEIYHSMYYIDLKQNLIETYTSKGTIATNERSKASAALHFLAMDNVAQQYQKEALAFMDMTDIATRMKGKKLIFLDYMNKHDGWIRATFITIEADEREYPIHVMLTLMAIDNEKNREEYLIRRSNTDEMTGCYNRRAYEEDIASYETEQIEDDFIYVLADINGLKAVNDTLGHAAGDELIQGAADTLRACFSKYGRIYRTGGDEFVILLLAKPNEIAEIQEEFRDTVDSWTGECAKSLSISCGYATRREFKDATLKEIALEADKRMYEEKNAYYIRNGIDRRKR